MHKADTPSNVPPPSATEAQASVTDAQLAAQANSIIINAQMPTWQKDLTTLLNDMLVQIYMDSSEHAKGQTGHESAPDAFHMNAQMYRTQRTAQLVTKLEDTTRKMLQTDLINGMKDGDTPAEIARTMEKNYAFSESRAETIARTETGFAWNHAGIKTYQDGGAHAVRVFDGDYDSDCAEADGQVWSFDYAMNHLLQHPRCVRSFAPEMENVPLDRGDTQVIEGGEA